MVLEYRNNQHIRQQDVLAAPYSRPDGKKKAENKPSAGGVSQRKADFLRDVGRGGDRR